MSTPLATVADLQLRNITVNPGEEPLAGAFLASASTAVQDAAGCLIAQATSTIDLEGCRGQYLKLLNLPIDSVAAVLIDGVAVTDWVLRIDGLYRHRGWQRTCEPSTVTVTYTHGLAEVPADIVDLVCSLAGQALAASRTTDGPVPPPAWLERVAIDDYSETYTRATERPITPIQIPSATRAWLAARFGTSAGAATSR